MKITETSNTRPASSVSKKRKITEAAGDFQHYLSTDEVGGATEVDAPSDVQPPSSLDALLALQEVSEEQKDDQQAYVQGQSQLDMLEELRDALLMGGVPYDILTSIQSAVEEQKAVASSPALLEIINEIEVRTAVELAKLERIAGKY